MGEIEMHTKGKWHCGVGNGNGAIFADEGRMRSEQGGTTLYPIALAIRGWDEAEDEANARLIAAAPELLAMLTKADAWIAMYHDKPGHDAASRHMTDAIRAVIAKVGGAA